jgi:hypothetical protein
VLCHLSRLDQVACPQLSNRMLCLAQQEVRRGTKRGP